MGRGIAIIDPLKMRIIQSQSTELGPPYLSSSTPRDFSILVKRQGSSIEGGIYIAEENSQIGGLIDKRSRPKVGGLMPSNFDEPMELRYSFDDVTTSNELLGQTEELVREFQLFKSWTSMGLATEAYKNCRLISYAGELYLIGEFYQWSGETYSGYVFLSRWIESQGSFFLIKKFDQVVDTNDIGANYQYGSPSFAEIDGVGYIAYRYVNRIDASNNVIIYTSEDGALTEWEERSTFQIENTRDLEYSRFRLRLAAGASTLCCVTYAVSTFDRVVGASTRSLEVPDMRSFYSFDDGYSWDTKHKRYTNVFISDQEQVLTAKDSSNMAYYFIPEFREGASELSYTGWNEKFDLYYDLSLGSFVILKGGDPSNSWGNHTFLIGLKTSEKSYFEWDICIQHRVSSSTSIDPPPDQDPFFPYNDEVDDVRDNSFSIQDVVVIPGEGQNKVLYQLKNFFSISGYENNGIGLSSFKFVSTSRIPAGIYEEIFAYGGKYHPEWSYVGAPINKDMAGFIGNGSPTPTASSIALFEPWSGLMGCSHRGRVVGSAKIDNNYRFLCYMSAIQNIEEVHGYQLAYTGAMPNYSCIRFEANQISGGTVVSSPDQGYIQYTSTSSASRADIYHDVPVENVPTIMERIGLSSPAYYKFRMGLSVTGISGAEYVDVAEFSTSLSPTKGRSFTIRVMADKTIKLMNYDRTTTYLTTSALAFDFGDRIELLLGCGEHRTGGPRVYLWWRQQGERVWQFGGGVVIAFDNPSFGSELAVGLVRTTGAVVTVRIYDFQMSAMDQGFRPIFSPSKQRGPTQEGWSRYTLTPEDYIDPHISPTLKSYSNELELHDGTLLSLVGSELSTDVGFFRLDRSKYKNSKANLFDNFSDYIFEFGAEYDDLSKYSIKFEPIFGGRFSTISLINMVGIRGFAIRYGTYDELLDTWSPEHISYFTIPREQLEFEATNGRRAILSNPKPANSLNGLTVFVYDELASEWHSSYTVIKNDGVIVSLDRNLPSMFGKSLWLMDQSATFEFPTEIPSSQVETLEIIFTGSESNDKMGVGEVVLGTLVDISDAVSNITETSVTDTATIISEVGYSYSPYIGSAPIYKSWALELSNLTSSQMATFGTKLLTLFGREGNKVVVVGDEGGNNITQFATIAGELRKNFSGYLQSTTMTLLVHSFDNDKRYINYPTPPSGIIYTLTPEVDPGTTVNFVSQISGVGPLTYEWNFGEGSTSSIANPVNTYAIGGEYDVSCVVTTAEGASKTFRTRVYVGNAAIASYSYATSLVEPIASLTPFTITFSALDRTGALMTYEDFMSVNLYTPDLVNIDGDLDTIYNEVDEDFDKRLEGGQATYGLIAVSAGVKNFELTDVDGRVLRFTLTFT